MKRLVLFGKRGFVAKKPFKIFDERNKLFYSDTFTNMMKKGEPLYFNLPKGEYKLEGSIFKLNNPVKQKEIHLPKKERNIPKRKFHIMYGTNPNKCTVFWKNSVILFDNSFLEVPKYILFDIFFHELGHRFYKTEHLADLYATKRMLQVGFNKSQIGRSVMDTLSDNSHYRKVMKIESMKS